MSGIDRRLVVAGLAAPFVQRISPVQAATRVLRIAHPVPAAMDEKGDFRDRLCHMFGRGVAERTGGSLSVEVYPNSSLMKTNAMFSAMRKGALDMSLYPLPFAGGEVREMNIGLIPCLVSSYGQGFGWKSAEVGRRLTGLLQEKGVVLVTWIWSAGGVAARARELVTPADAKGLKVRGGSREIDRMLEAAGAATLSLPANENYVAMQTGAIDAVITSMQSLVSFRLEELTKNITVAVPRSFWFMLTPLMMSKRIFDALSKAERDAVMEVGASLEGFARAEAVAADAAAGVIYEKAGARSHQMTDDILRQWTEIARQTSWRDYASVSTEAAALIEAAQKVAG